jgi:DNA-binding CsgD family transcriptional regulator
LLLDGLALLAIEGYAAATPALQRAAKALLDIPVEDVLRWGWAATGASAAVWDDEGYRAISTRLVQLVRDAGALAQLPLHLSSLALARTWMGDLADAASLVAEVEIVAAATGSRLPPNAALRLRALQGNEAEATAAIASAIEQAEAGGPGMAGSWAQWGAAVLYNGLGRYEDAAAAAQHASSSSFDPWASMWALPELVEAAARVGNEELARSALGRLSETSGTCDTDWALGIAARCRALVSDGAAADELYREAIERLGRTEIRTELARGHLVYGEWLRGENRHADAAAQLRTAHDQFTAIGMEAFAERARKELLAIGERVRHRAVKMRDDLTPQERQIAFLARDGLSNPEIGSRLFLSPRTIEWHLGNAFTKLGIRSRRELSNALRSLESEPVSA